MIEGSDTTAILSQRLDRPVVLIGTGGAGKTTIGKLLAVRLGLPFVDSDKVLEEKEGRTIPEIFKEDGEPYFRDLERETIRHCIAKGERSIVSTGGGAFMKADTRDLILKQSVSIFLKARLETLLKRVGNGEGRPLFDHKDPREVLSAMIENRYPVYEQADIVVNSDFDSAEETTEKLIHALYKALT
jgi:shikimate kinase